MERTYIENKTFESIDFTKDLLTEGDYEDCNFIDCNFSNLNLSNIKFIESDFVNCNLSLATLTKTAFRDIKFKNCKLLGLHFDNCNELLFAVNFDNCQLNLSSFYKRNLKKTIFKDSSLEEVDFTETDLSSSLFYNCNLTKATFENTILEKADFLTSYNYSIDPEKNRIKKAKFSMSGIVGLLDKYDIEIN